MLRESGEFVINLPDEKLVKALDYCGVRSIATIDKWKEMGLHEEESAMVSAPSIKEAPVSIECKVTQVLPLGSHDMFLAEVVAVRVDEQFIDEKGAFHMDQVGLVAYSHGDYMSLGEKLGSFGYSVRKKPLPVKKQHSRIKKTAEKVNTSAKPTTNRKTSKKKPSSQKPSDKKNRF